MLRTDSCFIHTFFQGGCFFFKQPLKILQTTPQAETHFSHKPQSPLQEEYFINSPDNNACFGNENNFMQYESDDTKFDTDEFLNLNLEDEESMDISTSDKNVEVMSKMVKIFLVVFDMTLVL